MSTRSEKEPLTLEDKEKQAIFAAIEVCGGNKTRAAERLGISIRTIQRKLKRYANETK
jgi:DNA-binding NtrC family response regulator